MAPRWGGLRPEPYDPDARDADGDGIVQEQTAWERPVGTNLVDELGRAITRGSNVGARPRGMRVVDSGGKDVDYTPTYARPGAAPGAERVGGATALADHGSGSLKERGLPTVRAAAAPKVPKPEVPVENPTPKGLDSKAIKQKNKSIKERLTAAGSTWGRIRKKDIDEGGRNGQTFKVDLDPEERLASTRARMDRSLSAIRDELTGASKDKTGLELTTHKSNLGDVLRREPEMLDGLHPEIKKLIIESSNEELIGMLEDAAVDLHGGLGDGQLAVAVPEYRLEMLFGDGSYKTQHVLTEEMNSGGIGRPSPNSPAGMRKEYELLQGLDPSTPSELRPASGYIAHPDMLEQEKSEQLARLDATGKSIPDDTSLLPLTTARGDTGSLEGSNPGANGGYGAVHVVLKDDVKDRVIVTRGDALNSQSQPVALDETDRTLIINSILGVTQSAGPLADDEAAVASLNFLNLLEARRTGSFGRANAVNGFTPDAPDATLNPTWYYEAAIAGSFEIDEVAEIAFPYHSLGTNGSLGGTRDEQVKALSEALSPERLESLGFTSQESAQVVEMLNVFATQTKSAGGVSAPNVPWFGADYDSGDSRRNFQALSSALRLQTYDELASQHGITIRPTNNGGLDPRDVSIYADRRPGETNAAQVLTRRLAESLAADLRKYVPPTPDSPSDGSFSSGIG